MARICDRERAGSVCERAREPTYVHPVHETAHSPPHHHITNSSRKELTKATLLGRLFTAICHCCFCSHCDTSKRMLDFSVLKVRAWACDVSNRCPKKERGVKFFMSVSKLHILLEVNNEIISTEQRHCYTLLKRIGRRNSDPGFYKINIIIWYDKFTGVKIY